MSKIRFKYQTIEFESIDIHVRTLRDTQEFFDKNDEAKKLGIHPASWSLFGVLWPSSEVLANFMYKFDTKSKKILEVGCGMGLSSLLLNHTGKDITATDYHPEVESYLDENTQLNGDKNIPFFRQDWGNEKDIELGKFDLVIGSDLLYEPDHFDLLSRFINRHVHKKCEIIIVDANRGNHPKFTKKMLEFGFSHERLDIDEYINKPFKGSIHYYTRKI